MIIYNTTTSKEISIAVWKIAEIEEYFWNRLDLLAEDALRIRNIKLQNVRLQKLACRAALATLLDTNKIAITYSDTGQPLLKDHCISFSHTKTAVAVALAKNTVGIDIEELSQRILPLYHKFMSREEIDSCNINDLNDLYYFWCAKEAMYKWYGKKNLDFIEDLRVLKNEKKGIICGEHVLQLVDIVVDNQLVVSCF